MSEFNPQVVRIGKVENHPNADALDITNVLGEYPVIIKRGQYKQGDLAAYLPVDSVVSDDPTFDFLGAHKRIKAKRLRGIFSMGLLVDAPPGHTEGDSIIDAYGIKKYVFEEEEAERRLKLGGEHDKSPEGWTIPHYDLEGLRNRACSSNFVDGETVILTEKLEGSYICYAHDGERLWTKSKNYWRRNESGSAWWMPAIRENLEERLRPYPGLAFFGELIGGIKGFKYDCPIIDHHVHPKFVLFDIFNIKIMQYLDYDDMIVVAKEIGLETVPLLYRGPYTGKDLYSFAEGQSLLGGNIREGFVMRPEKERVDGYFSRVIGKLKGEGYLLKKG